MTTPPSKFKDGWPNYRSPHRRRADAEAHATPASAPPILDHPLVPAKPPTLVQTQRDLSALVDTLRAEGRFGYDTEFIGEETFYLRFCVIQVATPHDVYLIDALAAGDVSREVGVREIGTESTPSLASAPDSHTPTSRPHALGIDLLPFWELIADPDVEVIVHAGLQDLEPVQRFTGKPPANVFDTQIAAGFIGLPYPVSLVNLVLNLTGADLGTSSKFSQWDRRPLTAVQQAYAANDVRYLLLLRERVGDKLAELGHADKARAEFEPFARPSTYRIDPLTMKLKAKGGNTLRRKEQAIVNALLLWRAREAEQRNLPMRALIDDQVLVDLAKNPVTCEADVKSFRGMPWPVKETYATELVTLTAQALEGPLPKRGKSYKPLSDAGVALLERVWSDCLAACESASIAPSIAMTKREVTALVRAHLAGRSLDGDEASSRLLRGWRGELLGDVVRTALTRESEASPTTQATPGDEA